MSGKRGGLTLGVWTAGSLAALCAATPVRQPHARLSYPTAARGSVVERYHGTAVADPYRWLEDLDAPATRAWVSAEATLTHRYLETLPQRARIRARIAELYDFEKRGIPFREAGRYFYTDNSGHQDQSVLLTATRLSDVSTVAVDPNTLPAAGNPVVTGYVPNRAGTLLAYAVALSGSDWTEWRVRDLATGQDLPDVMRFTKYYEPAFTPDGRGLYYSAFPAPQPGAELGIRDLGNALYYHALGTAAAADRRVLEVSAHPDWQFEPHLSGDGRWLIVRAGEGQVGDKGRDEPVSDRSHGERADRDPGGARLRGCLHLCRRRRRLALFPHLTERSEWTGAGNRHQQPGAGKLEERDPAGA